MRIDRLDLIAYGSFTNASLDLSGGDSGLHVIYGNNEAGKSTSLRALIAWLFGIPARCSDNYLYSNAQLRIGGKLRLASGDELEFVRRKGAKSTVLAPHTDAAMNDSVLLPYLSGTDETLFVKLYGIDHGRLIAGGQELLNQSGDLGQALFSAALGSASLRKILSDLQDAAEALFSPRATTKPINQAASGFRDAQKRVRDSSLLVAEWTKLQADLANTGCDIERVEVEISAKTKDKNRYERLNRVKGALAERRTVMSQIEELGDVLLLADDFDEARKSACDSLRTAKEARAKAEGRLSRLGQELQSLTLRNELLDNEGEILSIYRELGAAEKAEMDRPRQDGQRRFLRNEAVELLKAVRPDLGIEDADQLRPLTNNKKWIAGLATRHGLLSQKKERAAETLQDVQCDQEALRKALGEQIQSQLKLSDLQLAVGVARKAGDLEQRWAVSQKRAADEQASCERELARLGRFSGTINSLSITAMPVTETMARFERQFDDLSQEIRDLERKQHETLEERRLAEQSLQALLLTGHVPTLAELRESRNVRNTGWNLIKAKYLESGDVEEDIIRFARGSDLPEVYEQKVAAADDISDLLRTAADDVVKRADLEARIASLTSRLGQIAERAKAANESNEILQREWKALWEPLEVAAGTPREMTQWVLRVEKLLASVQNANATLADRNRLAEECDVLRKAMSLQISRFDDSIDLRETSLEAMIHLCEQRIKREEADLERKRQLQRSLEEAETRIKRARGELASIESEKANWALEWAQAIEGLGLRSDCHPEQATEVFDRLVAFFGRFDESEDLRRRIYGIDQVLAQFQQKVFQFCDAVGFDRNGQKANAIAVRLNGDLSQAREARASLKNLEAQAKEIREEIHDADTTIQAAQEQLGALRVQACVETDDELVPAGDSSRRMRGLQRQLDSLERELTRNGDGLSIEQLEKEAKAADLGAIDGDLNRVCSDLKDLQAARDRLRDERKTLENAIRAKDGSAHAARASEEAEEHLATIVSDGEQYLRLKAAALILERRIEDYRKKNQAPVLVRAAEYFCKLTLGSFANLRDEMDDNGRPVLLGVRANGKEVAVDGMSDGTRDQLYLSLRLATLEQHLSKGEPVPFVVDDILVGFDENRTRACIDVLAEFASRTQVLLFTHHWRVLELAKAIRADAGVFAHELSQPGG